MTNSEVTKVPVEPARKSSRLSGKPVKYDDDIEIIEKNLLKLSLSAQRKMKNWKKSNKMMIIWRNNDET